MANKEEYFYSILNGLVKLRDCKLPEAEEFLKEIDKLVWDKLDDLGED